MRSSKDKSRPLSQNKKALQKRTKTEVGPLYQQYLQTEIPAQKVKIQKQTILKILTLISQNLSDLVNKYQTFQQKKVLSNTHLQKVAQHFFFLASKFFRFQKSSHSESITNLKSLNNASKILYSALMNSQQNKKDRSLIFIKQQQQFCEFFKLLLGKECQQFRQKYLRKILQEVWNFAFFYEKDMNRIIDTLVIWAHGISVPLNPARMKLHKAVIKEDIEFIKKACQFKVKSPIYCHVNEADNNGITPLMLATYLQKQKVFSTLLLEYADPYLVPLTKMPNSKKIFQQIVEQIQLLRGPLKFQTLPYPQAYNKNVIQYCRDNNLPLLTKLLALDNSRQFHSLKINRSLIQNIEKIPDCSFQITWKKQAKLFGEGISDTIKIFKKRANIRFDFHTIGVFDKNISKADYSLIFKGKPDIQYYLVDYENKRIVNLIKQLDLQSLEDTVIKIFKDIVVGKQELVQCLIQQNIIKNNKNNYKRTILNLTFQKQTIKKDNIKKQDFKHYQESLSNSKAIQYTKLTHSETYYVLQEHLPASYPQPSRKKTQEKVKLEISTIPFFQLSMDHLLTICTILQYYSPHFHKLSETLKWQRMLSELCSKGIYKQFPSKITAEMKGINLTIQLQNFNFQETIKNDMFELLSKLEEQSFDCILPRGTSFVKSQNQSLQESFASSVSRFFSKQDDKELEDAYSKYQNILDELNEDDIKIEYQNYNPKDKSSSAFSKKNKRSQIVVSKFKQ